MEEGDNRKVQAYGLAQWRNGIENKISMGLYAIKSQLKWNLSLMEIGQVPCFSKQDKIQWKLMTGPVDLMRVGIGNVKCVGMGLLMGPSKPLFI